MALRSSIHPIPEWENTEVLIVDPSVWPFYCRAPRDLRPVYRDLTRALDALGVPFQLLSAADHPLDIWVRDWGPVEGCFFEYRPSYAPNSYSAAAIRRSRQVLARRSGQVFRSVPLVLDGGNLVHNGRVAILTEKVLRDNPCRSRADIEQMIRSMGFDQVVFIPVEPQDEVGHADGTVRFLTADVLLVNDYRHPHFSRYRKQLLARLAELIHPISIVPFPWRCSDEKIDGLWSAVGVYLNFIHVSQGILLPSFGEPEDREAAALLSSLSRSRVVPISCRALARLGGVLNCITASFGR